MIHPTAIIADSARLAENVTVGPYAVIGADVSIGAGSTVDAHVVIEGPTRIGEGNRFHPFSSIGGPPQDKKYAGERTTLSIGNGNTIRENVTINRGTSQDRGDTQIGDDNWIMAYVHVAHDCVVGDHTILANNVTLAGHVHVGDYAILGGFTKVHQFCRIGAHAFCSMNCDLNKDVPPYITAAGRMAVPRGINVEGLKRRGYTSDAIRKIRLAYKVLYRSDLGLEEALVRMADDFGDEPALEDFVRFLRESERSIIR